MFSLMGNCVSCIKSRREPRRELTLAILGLDSAGKTTTAKALLGEPLDTAPTVGFNKEEVQFHNYDITLFDLGGGKRIRDIWKNYLPEVYGLIYVVDSSSREKIPEVKENLERLLQHEQVQQKPLLLLANKQDLPNRMDEVDFCEQLHLEELVNRNKCPCRMEMCSAIHGTGKKMDKSIKSGMTWLCNVIEQGFEGLSSRVEQDMAVANERKKLELEAKRERVRKQKEEREKQEAEEKKRLGIAEEEGEEDWTDGDPFRRVDNRFRTDIQKQEDKLKEEKRIKKEKIKKQQAIDMTVNERKRKESENNDTDDNDIRMPRSSRTLNSYGLSNGNILRSDVNQNTQKSDDEDSDSFISPSARMNRRKLPPLQSPLGTKFEPEQKSRKKKNRFDKGDLEDNNSPYHPNNNPVTDRFGLSNVSVSRIQVSSVEPPSDDEQVYTREDQEESRHTQSGIRSYRLEGDEEDALKNSPVSGRKKKGKKKKPRPSASAEDEGSGFDTLRLSQNLEDDLESAKSPKTPVYGKPPRNARVLSSLDGGDGEDYNVSSRALTPVKKLKKKKKKNMLRKNKLAPSDDEFELSDVHDSPSKKPLPWEQSPRRIMETVESYEPVSKWGLAEDLPEVESSPRRRRPNFGSDEDLVL